MKARKTWRDKLENPRKWEERFGGRRVLVPVGDGRITLVVTPYLVDDLIRKVQRGKLVTIRQLTERLDQVSKGTGSACGLLIRIAAETAEEDSSR